MTNFEKIPITVTDKTIEYVKQYTYLGQGKSPTDLTNKELNNRIN